MRRLFMYLSLLLCRCDAAWTCKWLYNIWSKPKSFAQFPVDHFPYQDVPVHILPSHFPAITYYEYIYICIYPTLHREKYVTQGQFFSGRLTGLSSEFYFTVTNCCTKVKEPRLPNYLSIARRGEYFYSNFSEAFCEMQTALFRIWTHVASIIFLRW